MEGLRRAEDHGDYRLFRWIAVNGARLVLACLFLIAWNLVFYQEWAAIRFLGTTGFLALFVSLGAALVSYTLYKRRGGKIEKTPKPMMPQDAGT